MTQWDIDPQKFRARLKPNWGDTSGIPLGTPPCNLPKSRQSATCHTSWSKYNKGSFRSLSTDIQSVACRVPCIPSPARVWLVIPWGSRYESTDCPMWGYLGGVPEDGIPPKICPEDRIPNFWVEDRIRTYICLKLRYIRIELVYMIILSLRRSDTLKFQRTIFPGF